MKKPKITGIGGIFFKCQDPATMKQWYSQHLGFQTDQYGCMFEFREVGQPDQAAYLQWSPFDAQTQYFAPSDKDFMINYRVTHLETLAQQLQTQGVTILDEIQSYPYGKFLHILDPEGNKIELWEPIDQAFTDATEEEGK